ncbi:hypothetical protein L288_19265 [Sphingobium quisquiliarum P25]|uniref:Uncharacterized protein n=1 Tax=Sphingobium quisquiliarum P25 TaxID=1329909 RepID=T0HKL4_9SPHN|nr:hypothetical protein [Sphingobium quisquiliarum]EQA99824.1 hypothetical protein L288_19265 [Sphingobium quisquiliarum P25]
MDWSQLTGALIGLVGVPLGIVLGELLRRRQRAEQFAATIFAKRLEAYDALLSTLFESYRIANEVIDNQKLSAAERHELISAAIMPIAEHTTRSALYIDEELGAHCTALFMGVEDLRDLPKSEQQARLAQFRRDWRETRRMILEDSGVTKVNRLFRDINRPRINSPVIERIRELQREQDG